MKSSTCLLLLLAAGFLVPDALLGQACIGVPIGSREAALTGGASFTEGVKAFGARAAFNQPGPISLEAGYDLVTFDDIDTNANSFSAGAAVELPVVGISVCPVTGVSHMRWSEQVDALDFTITSTVIPIGMGIGRELPAGPNLSVTFFGIPRFLHVRSSLSGSEGAASLSVSDNTNEFGAALGVTLGSDSFYVGAGVNLTTIEDSDPTFGISMGVIVG